MARDYEVREEYKGYGLAQLLDSPVLCFQGVGEIPAALLRQYFNISTVRDLANMDQFMWALELQELAVNAGELATQSIRSLAAQRELKFKVRERCMDMTPTELMHSTIQDLDGLSPAQDLALYDIFRITNIAQLAQNRIMLESRVIQYLEQGKGEGGELATEGVASVLGQQQEDTVSQTGSAVQRITEARRGPRDERLETSAIETREHVRDRLETLRERAQTGPARAAERGAAAGTGDRLSAIRDTRTRAQPAGRQAAGGTAPGEGGPAARDSSIAGRAQALLAARSGTRTAAPPSAAPATTRPTAARTVTVTRPTPTTTGRSLPPAAARTTPDTARPAGAAPSTGAGGAGARSAASAGAAGATARNAATAGAAGATVTPPAPGSPAAGAEAPADAAAAAPPRRVNAVPIIVFAAVAVIIIIALVWLVSRRGPPAPVQAPTAGSTAPGATGTSGTAVGPGGAPGVAGAGAPGEQPTKAVHTVREGQSLWRISKKYYEDGSYWTKIYDRNKDEIKQPDLIYPSQKFKIPVDP